MRERERHREAFERYVAQGRGRSLERLAAETTVSVSALKAWSRAFRWGERLEARSREVAETLARDTVQSDADRRRSDKRLVEMALVHIAKAVLEGRTKPSIGDMDRMIRLKLELEGNGRSQAPKEFVVRRDGYARPEDEPDDAGGEEAVS